MSISVSSKNPMFADTPKSSGDGTTAAELNTRFISLLIAQIQNQDPLSPMDNAAVTSQMADLSTVSGIEKMNQSLIGVSAQLNASLATQANSFLGKDISFYTDEVNLKDGKGSEITYRNTDNNADIVIRDNKGDIVYRGKADSTGNTIRFAWDGISKDDAKMKDGQYSIELVSGEGVATKYYPTFAQEEVSGVRSDPTLGAVIETASGREIPLSLVQGVFARG